jgi:hypothetical protein
MPRAGRRLLAVLLASTLLGAAAHGQQSVYFAGEAAGVGDPNPYAEDGVYSVFYLQNKGRHPWWMTQTSDLASYSAPVEAIPVGEAGAPDFWTGSGSVVRAGDGQYHIFYTGHDPEGQPKEVTMHASATALGGPWQKHAADSFSGLPTYSEWDFRDPYVFWNTEADAWWMLMTTRYADKAAIGLYTSPDLSTWTADGPLYSEVSDLNLEVPDLFPAGDDWFLLYSDQRGNSRQVRYLSAASSGGPYAYGPFDALDGKGFYAGKSAGDEDERLLFGWVPHKQLRKDAMDFVWGGDLVVHELERSGEGMLGVHLPDMIRAQFDTERQAIGLEATELGGADTPLLLTASLDIGAGDRFGVALTARNSGRVSSIVLDDALGVASFLYNDDSTFAPSVRYPVPEDGRYRLDLVIDPVLGLGILYINDFRALSFRYYKVAGTKLSLFSDTGFTALEGSVFTRTRDTEEAKNG